MNKGLILYLNKDFHPLDTVYFLAQIELMSVFGVILLIGLEKLQLVDNGGCEVCMAIQPTRVFSLNKHKRHIHLQWEEPRLIFIDEPRQRQVGRKTMESLTFIFLFI